MRVLFWFLLSFLILFLSHQTFPQTHIHEGNIQFKHLTKEQGLSDGYINCMLQDSKGFIWIGTLEGLNRYDGRKVKVFKPSPDDPNSLGIGGVYALCEDKSENLWVGTGGGGLNKYNAEQENFTRYLNPDDSSSVANYILSIYEDKSGVLWVGTQYTGLFMFDQKSVELTYYKNIPGDSASISENRIWTFYEDSKNNLWIGTLSAGLNKFDRQNKIFHRYINNPNDPASLSFNTVSGIREDNSGNLWIATYGGGLNKLTFKGNENQPRFTHHKYDPNNITGLKDNYLVFIYIDKSNFMWLGSSQEGLSKTIKSLDDISTLSLISYKHDPLDKYSLLGNYVSWIYQDNSELLWIANQGEGLNIFNTRQKQFRYYKHNPDDPFSLSNNRVTVVFEDKSGILWIGTRDGGLNKLDKAANRATCYKHNPSDSNSLSNDFITSIYEDRSGILWVGTYYGGLNKFDRKTEKFYAYKHDPLNPKSIREDIVVSIAEDKSGILWIGTPDNGLYKFDKGSEDFTYISYNPAKTNGLSSTWADALYVDSSGILWISAKDDGLYTFDYQKNKFVNYEHDPKNPNSLSDNTVNVIYEDKTGIFWFGTKDGGLNRYNRKNGQFKHFKMKDGLPSDYVMGVLEDERNNLWISTSNGLSKFNIQTETFRNYDVEDGLPTNEFDELACYKSKTGELIFGSSNGFIIFHPDSIKDNTHIPPVYITDFYLFNKPVPTGYDSLSGRTILSKAILECEELKLNYDENVFSFEFAALDFQAPAKNKYAYTMEGFDKDWTFTNASRTIATYTNLGPGEYIFRVKGSNNDGIWNEAGASIKIIILPPWWRTNWAYLFYVLFIGSALYFTWKSQLKRIKIKHEYEMSRFEAQKLHEVDQIKSRFFTNISHEFRTPLTLILGPAKQIFEKVKDEKIKSELSLIHSNARKLLELVNQLLDISKIESENMKLQTVQQNIVPFIKALVLSFTSYAERKRISLNFYSAENEIIAYLDNEKLEKIITNILSNAFKFTASGGRIAVIVNMDEDSVNIVISDTGIGIPNEKLPKIFDRFYQVDGSHTREQEGTGIGLSITKELVELHKGKIEVESEEGKGTTFTVSFLLRREHLKPEEIIKEEGEKSNEKEILIPEFSGEGSRERESKISVEIFEKELLPLLLIVEDNSDVRYYIKENLKKEYKIVEAVDGEDGWNKSVEYIPDLIVSDVMMPKMDGFKLCVKLKTDTSTSHIPVILLTAKAAKENKLEGYETGADDYILKPFEPDELRARIKNLIGQRKRLHEHFQKEGIFGLDKTRITSADKKFLQKAYEIISQNISNESFGVEVLAESLSVSKSLLHKKIVALTGEPPVEFIRRIRLNKAASLIENKFGNLSQIALEVGFSNPAYFSECFKKQFGVPPSHYQRNKEQP